MDTEPIPPARKRATHKGDATREAVKQAAKRAIAIDGFAAVKIADIMGQAGKSPAAFYLYFKSKEVLLHELLEEFRLRLKDEVNRSSEAEDPLANLADRLEAFWKIYREDWPIATAAFQMSMVDQQFARAWRNVRQQGIRGLSAMIMKAQQQGFSPGVDTELAASALCSMLEYTCYNWTAKGGDFPDRFIDDATALNVLTQLFVHAVGWQPLSHASYEAAQALVAARRSGKGAAAAVP
ncbi:TetR/AcrR family transcriptional regulator [uncultured Pseudacidovorax sp.]|uniref:TetR/AcrR family transcriptional regulator n=1 Tax=uncultured Pseudacidovorax sp. TaxID=679313 RepID=UPI0026011E9D|nr:TetR/AcrR family transcriptional regulator [uncultured Pseudacidovorax sp.]